MVLNKQGHSTPPRLFVWDNDILIPISVVLQVCLEGVENGEIIEAPERGEVAQRDF